MCRRSHVHLLMCDSDFARRGAFACICFALYVHVAVPLAGAVYFSCCCVQRGAVFPPACAVQSVCVHAHLLGLATRFAVLSQVLLFLVLR